MSSINDTMTSAWRLPLLALAAMLALLLAMTSETVASMVTVWRAATTYHHCFLVLPISLFLIWQKRDRIAGLTPRQEPLALCLLVAFALVWLVGRAGQIQLFQHIALVGLAISITLALLGRDIARVIAFPLAFLGFMVPFGDFLVPSLQQFTANFSVALLRLFEIPVFHDGIMIQTPSGLFEVAEACAGIRFLIANVVVATLFAYLAMTGLWRWVLFLALSVIIPIIANGFRAFGIILIAYLSDNEYAAGVDHLVYGWGFFAAVMLLFLAIGSWIADWPDVSSETGSTRGSSGALPWSPALVLPVALLIAAAPLYANTILDRAPGPIAFTSDRTLSAALAADLAPVCKPTGGDDAAWRPTFAKADLTEGLNLDCGGQPVDLFLAYYAYERDGAELIHHANRLADGEAWIRTSASWYAPEIDGLPSTLRREELYGRRTGERLVLAWYWIGGRQVARDWQAKAYQLIQKLLGRDEPAALIALSTPYADRPDDVLPGLTEVLQQHKGISTYLSDLAPSE